MDSYLSISAIGPARAQYIEPLTQAVKDCGCSILDSRMTVLGNQFGIMLLLAGSWDSVAKVENSVIRLQEQFGIKTLVERTLVETREGKFMPYAIEIVAIDDFEIIHSVIEFFTDRNIATDDLISGTYTGNHSETKMLQLHLNVNVPGDISITNLRGDFMEFCEQLNLDAIMEPAK